MHFSQILHTNCAHKIHTPVGTRHSLADKVQRLRGGLDQARPRARVINGIGGRLLWWCYSCCRWVLLLVGAAEEKSVGLWLGVRVLLCGIGKMEVSSWVAGVKQGWFDGRRMSLLLKLLSLQTTLLAVQSHKHTLTSKRLPAVSSPGYGMTCTAAISSVSKV